MNRVIAEIYKTDETIRRNRGEEMEKSAEAALLEQLEKVASDLSIDLNELSDDDILEVLQEALGAEKTAAAAPVAAAPAAEAAAPAATETEKTAAAEAEQEKLAAAVFEELDTYGRVMAHAMYDELAKIKMAEANTRPSDMFKVASADVSEEEVVQALEELALERANMVIASIDGGEVKQSSVEGLDSEELDNAVWERAGEILDENGYDVDAIVKHFEAN